MQKKVIYYLDIQTIKRDSIVKGLMKHINTKLYLVLDFRYNDLILCLKEFYICSIANTPLQFLSITTELLHYITLSTNTCN